MYGTYEAKDIVKVVTLSHPALGATDESRVLFRCTLHTPGKVTWVIYRSKGPFVDKMCFDVYPTRKAALAAIIRPASQGFNFRENRPIPAVPLRPCSCSNSGSTWKCPEHRSN